MRLKIAAIVLPCLGVIFALGNIGHAAQAAVKPNIVIIIADDLGYGDLGCYGATKIKTPNMDRLAAEGVRFTQGYAPSSTCTPSRFSLLTGEYAWRQKARNNNILAGDAPLCIEPGRLTLPAMLRNAGYKTGIVGKWHLGLGDGQTPVDFNGEVKPGPLEIGFEYSHIIPATVDRVPSVWIENHKVVGLDPADPIKVSYVTNISDEPTGIQRPDLLKQKADKQHSDTIINGISRIGYMKGGKAARFKDEELANTVVAKSVEFIERHQNAPFFLEVGLFEPHVPRVAEAQFVGTSDCGVRGDVIHQIDWEVGEITKALDRLHLTTNTLVILSSDNGAILFDGYYDHSVEDLNGHQPTAGLRGWKYLTFEGGCRVPFIARWPEAIKPRVSDQMFNLVDLFATFGSLTGQKIAAEVAPDSLDLSAVLVGTTTNNIRDNTVLHGISDALALRQGDWKFIPANVKGKVSTTGGANPSEARFAAGHIAEPLLFNLAADPNEKTNVIAQYPDQAAELRRKLADIRAAPQARAAPAPRSVKSGGKPNFVFILADDLGWGDLGCYGSTFYETPNLDRLAKQGMRFTDAYAACNVCSPTRAAIMTGKYPARLHLTDWLKGRPDRADQKLNRPNFQKFLPLEEVTVAEALKAGGYQTAFIGKWHLGDATNYFPEHQGFDVNIGGGSMGHPPSYFSPYGIPTLTDGPAGEYLNDRLTDEAVKFLEHAAKQDEPFLLYFAEYAVHTPLQARPEAIEKYKAKAAKLSAGAEKFGIEHEFKVRQVQNHPVYGAMVESLDTSVGRVLDKLKELGLETNTVVIFTSDNGGLSTAEGSPTSNLPLRAGKGWGYEGGVREPLLVSWPGATQPGSVSHGQIISFDFYPTLLQLAGLPPRPAQHLDGESIVPLLKGGVLAVRPLFWHYPHYSNQGGAPHGAVRLGDFKLIEWYEDMGVELFNLKDDLGEQRDLAKANPTKAAELTKLLHDWRRQVNAQMPTPNPDYKPGKPGKSATAE